MTLQPKILCNSLLLFCMTLSLHAEPDYTKIIGLTWDQLDSIIKAQNETNLKDQEATLGLYSNALLHKRPDSVSIFKKVALLHAKLNHPSEAYVYTEKYVNNSLDFSIINDSAYDVIEKSDEFEKLVGRYQVHLGPLEVFYISIAIIGFFVAFVINFKGKSNRVANAYISGFIFVHSIFILEFALYFSKLQFLLPHTYFIAGSFALLYGPFLYLYFKKVVTGVGFRRKDLWHFLPTLILAIFLIPIYMATGQEKIRMLLGLETWHQSYGLTIFVLKLTSLTIYGALIGHFQFKKSNSKGRILVNEENRDHWKKNLYFIHVAFIISYFIYGITISGVLGDVFSFVYNLQVFTMSAMVLYVAFMAYVQPQIFSLMGNNKAIEETLLIPKYQKSGLTNSLSEELKNTLMKLLVEEKIFKDSGLSLELLSEKLNTTRHNTSQVINEHFGMNYFELINKFRINEVIEILKEDVYGNLNIIDIAYEVGYNNKVTFNKAFKKETDLTPSQFIESYRNKELVNYR